jgi:hypothetical protein
MNRPIITLLLAAIAALLLPVVALATSNPIPGIDIVVLKNPGGRALTVHVDGPGGDKPQFILAGADVPQSGKSRAELMLVAVKGGDINGDGVDDLTLTLSRKDAPRERSARNVALRGCVLLATDDLDGDGLAEYSFADGAAEAAGLLTEYVCQGSAAQAALLQGLLEGLADGSIALGKDSVSSGRGGDTTRTSDPIPGIDIVVLKNPGGIAFSVDIATGSGGKPVYRWTELSEVAAEKLTAQPDKAGGQDTAQAIGDPIPGRDVGLEPRPKQPESSPEPPRDTK